MNHQRINGIEQIEAALRCLESYGYPTAEAWQFHNEWQASMDVRSITDNDVKWASRADKQSSIEDHFVQVLRFPIYGPDHQEGDAPVGWREERQYAPELLTASGCFADRQYQLTSGQRDVLREKHGLTPAKTVIITNVTTFKATNVIASFTIRSAEHIDPRRRRHVLVEAVIAPAAQFFEQASMKDKEREAENAREDAVRVGRGESPKTVKQKALQYYE